MFESVRAFFRYNIFVLQFTGGAWSSTSSPPLEADFHTFETLEREEDERPDVYIQSYQEKDRIDRPNQPLMFDIKARYPVFTKVAP